jgi:hypothetical protein
VVVVVVVVVVVEEEEEEKEEEEDEGGRGVIIACVCMVGERAMERTSGSARWSKRENFKSLQSTQNLTKGP